jgi:hypothetical protein
MALRFELDWDGDRVTEEAQRGAVRGLRRGAEHLLAVSRQMTPREEGTLRRSGVASVDAATRTAAVSYDTPYAVYQHEELGLRHVEGGAKYLERPMHSERADILAIIGAEIRRALGT